MVSMKLISRASRIRARLIPGYPSRNSQRLVPAYTFKGLAKEMNLPQLIETIAGRLHDVKLNHTLPQLQLYMKYWLLATKSDY